jgi:hypothetical protein
LEFFYLICLFFFLSSWEVIVYSGDSPMYFSTSYLVMFVFLIYWNPQLILLTFIFIVFFLWDLDLNAELCTCKTGSLPTWVTPPVHFALVYFEDEVSWTMPWLALNLSSPDLNLFYLLCLGCVTFLVHDLCSFMNLENS